MVRSALQGPASAAAALVLAIGLAACGGAGQRTPDLRQLPVVPGARTVARVTTCDGGASGYCAVELVLYDRHFANSEDLLKAEREVLHAHGWTGANGDTGDESAADSPAHKLHLTYATANGDLDGLEFGWIERAKPIWLALSRSLFDRTPALSLLLEIGSGST